MGAASSCFSVNDDEDQNADGSVFRGCFCFGFFTSELLLMFQSLLGRRQQTRAILPSAQASNTAVVRAADDSECDTYRSPPRPLAYDDPRFSNLQHQGLILRHGKLSSQCHCEPDAPGSKGTGTYVVSTREKGSALECDKPNISQSPESSLKKAPGAFSYTYTSYEDEDSCPICLEEYTPENPSITMQCSHDFHLGCIYEWMERSNACPICGKMMLFEETK